MELMRERAVKYFQDKIETDRKEIFKTRNLTNFDLEKPEIGSKTYIKDFDCIDRREIEYFDSTNDLSCESEFFSKNERHYKNSSNFCENNLSRNFSDNEHNTNFINNYHEHNKSLTDDFHCSLIPIDIPQKPKKIPPLHRLLILIGARDSQNSLNEEENGNYNKKTSVSINVLFLI